MSYFYIYKLTHKKTKEFYIGSRKSKVKPIDDNFYLGSMTTWKPDKNQLIKEILNDNFETYEDARLAESELLKKVIKHHLNRNYHIPSVGFYCKFQTSDSIEKIKKGNIGLKRSKETCKNISKSRKKLSRTVKEKIRKNFSNNTKNKVVVKDENGKTFQVNKNDQRYLSGEFVGVNKDMVVIKNNNGEIKRIKKSDKTKEDKGVTAGKVTVKDKQGKTFNVNKNDQRYLSGELVHVASGHIPKNKGKNPIQKLKNNEVIQEWKNLLEFCNDTKIPKSTIVNWIKGKRKPSDGFQYKYKF